MSQQLMQVNTLVEFKSKRSSERRARAKKMNSMTATLKFEMANVTALKVRNMNAKMELEKKR